MTSRRLWQSRRLRVLVDMDSVLCDFEGHFLKCYKEKYPDEPCIPLIERNTFYIADQYVSTYGERYKPKVQSIYEAKGFFEDLPALDGAVDAVKEMMSMDDVDVFICTSPIKKFQYCVVEKYAWVAKHFGAHWLDRVILTNDKTVIKADLLIDDKPKIKGLEKEPPWKHVIFSADHNGHIKGKHEHRLHNWTDGQWKTLIEDVKKRI